MTGARFYDGQSPMAQTASIRLDASSLTITPAGSAAAIVWPIDLIDIVERHGASATFAYRGGEARLRIEDGEALQQIISTLRPSRTRRAVRLTASWSAAALALIAAGAFFIMVIWPTAADKVAALLPAQWLDTVGQTAVRTIVGSSKTCTAEAGAEVLDQLVRRLSSASGRPRPQVTVINSAPENAFALPENQILIMGGLIRRASHPNEIAGVMAHEMGHLVHRHPARQLVRQTGIFILVELFTGGSSAGAFGATAVTLNYTRAFEREADAYAMELLAKTGIDPAPVAGFFERMAKHGNGMFGWEYLSSHPDPAARAATFAASSGGGPAMSQAEFEALKKICE